MLLAALVAPALSPVWAADLPEAALGPRVGHAFDLDSGQPLYREHHEPEVEDGRLVADRVRYVAPDGELIARKEMSFRDHALAPAFRLEDLRTGHVAGLEWRDDGRAELFERKRRDSAMRRTVISAEPGLIADGGFDVLIYRNLEQLKAGETLRFAFAAPSEQDTIGFRLRRTDRRTVLGEPAVLIRMEPDNAFIRWLADPIDVAYHAETGALLRYEGVSNIPDPEADGNYRVRIDFPPEGVDPVPPGGD